ncbi:MAG: acyltransferase, partial [Duncaniella sp.]|nr:acyltransferase [Duncaniella sp.]
MNVIAETGFKGRRLGWMDAVRGVAMLLVVWHHFMNGAFSGVAAGVVETLTSFEVPLFFFVSGFFAWKAQWRADGVSLWRSLGHKARPLLCGTAVFYAVWQLRNGNGVLDFLFEGFWGYWFTVALFQMLVAYIAIVWLARRVGHESVVWWGLGALTVLTVGAVKVADGLLLTDRVCVVLSWYQVCNCFQFFAAGVVARRVWPRLERLMARRCTFPLSVAVFAGIVWLCHWDGLPHAVYQLPHGMAMRYAGVAMVVGGFYTCRMAVE